MSKDEFYENDDLIIITESGNNMAALECSVCEFLLRDQNDALTFENYQSCADCYLELIHHNLKKWKNGWRPSKKDKEIIIKKRINAPSYIIHE